MRDHGHQFALLACLRQLWLAGNWDMMNMLVCKVIELNNSTYYHLICTGDATVSYENVNLTTNSSYFMNSTCTGTEFNLAESSPKRTCSFACSKNTIRCYGQYKSMHIVFSFFLQIQAIRAMKEQFV